tara:strand:+ start:658 stop:1104 length:447 start_codon:yes stop_codon:yes gene_type:complete
MWIAVELVFHQYGPDEIKPGTLFMNLLYVGTDKEVVEVFEIDKQTADLANKRLINIDEFGYPVQPFLLDDDGKVVSTPDEIGWFDHPREEILQEFTTKEMNIVMRDFDGLLEIFIDEDEYEDNFIQPIYEQELVILRGLSPDEDDEVP